MQKSKRKSAIRGIIKSLKNYDDPDAPGETFRHLLSRVNNDLIPFFVVIDWKTSIGELNEWVRTKCGRISG